MCYKIRPVPTWTDIKDHARSSYTLAEEHENSFKVVFEYPGGRLQAVIAAHSSLVGQTVRQSRFRTIYDAAILAVHRQGVRVTETKVGDIRLQAGDVLLGKASCHLSLGQA